ncbi:MAG TPA: PQQ-binding-like beta-propeller repeat protein [Armatimonadota bacterium]|jgi:hypothetical protein
MKASVTYRILTLAALVSFLLAVSLSGALAEVVGWRGDGTGVYPKATPPTTWAKDKNVVWSTPLPSWGNSCPVLVGDKLFFCVEPTTLMCLSATDGKILWQKSNQYEDIAPADQAATVKAEQAQLADLQKQTQGVDDELAKVKVALEKTPADETLKAKQTELQTKREELNKQLQPLTKWIVPITHPTNGWSSPTPVSDGAHVWVAFGNGVVACYDLDGNRVWARLVEKPQHGWGTSASPTLTDNKLLVQFVTLHGLNPATGETFWNAKEVGMYWGSIITTNIGNVPVAITSNGFVVRAADGKILAKGLYGLSYNTPIIADGVLYFVEIPGWTRMAGRAFTLPTEAADSLTLKPVWNGRDERFYASPVYFEGLLYDVNQLDSLVVVDAANGLPIYEKKLGLGGTQYPSVTMAGQYIYVSSDSGATVVIEPGREYKEIARNTLEPFRGSPVFSGDRMYIHGLKTFYCLANTPAAAPAAQ